MADTIRSVGALQALFADNTAGNISAQNLRDFLVSAYQPQTLNGFRLTTLSQTPITTADRTAQSNLYLTPYTHDVIGLFDSVTSSWVAVQSAEANLGLSGLTSGQNYDVFAYLNSGTLLTELLAWTGATTRTVDLYYLNGVLTKVGAPTRRYVGTIRTTSTTATEDSEAKRFVFNAYHRVPKTLRKQDTTSSWNYSSTTWRQARATATNQVEAVVGIPGPVVNIQVCVTAGNSTAGVGGQGVGVAMDATNTYDAENVGGPGYSEVANGVGTCSASYRVAPAVGYHYWAWVEVCNNGTATFYGSPLGSVSPTGRSGISGTVEC